MKRDQQTLQRVYREHSGAVYAFLAYSVAREQAEDLTQTTFERVLRNWRRYDATLASERTWILAIARNALADHFRRQRFRNHVSLDAHPALLESLVASEDPVALAAGEAALADWLGELSERERTVLALRFGAELSAGEIAAELDLTEANVHQISSRALRKLRARAVAGDSAE